MWKNPIKISVKFLSIAKTFNRTFFDVQPSSGSLISATVNNFYNRRVVRVNMLFALFRVDSVYFRASFKYLHAVALSSRRPRSSPQSIVARALYIYSPFRKQSSNNPRTIPVDGVRGVNVGCPRNATRAHRTRTTMGDNWRAVGRLGLPVCSRLSPLITSPTV